MEVSIEFVILAKAENGFGSPFKMIS